MNKNSTKLQKIYNEILTFEQENCNRIEAEFQTLLLDITEKINQTSKNVKIKVMEKFAQTK